MYSLVVTRLLARTGFLVCLLPDGGVFCRFVPVALETSLQAFCARCLQMDTRRVLSALRRVTRPSDFLGLLCGL